MRLQFRKGTFQSPFPQELAEGITEATVEGRGVKGSPPECIIAGIGREKRIAFLKLGSLDTLHLNLQQGGGLVGNADPWVHPSLLGR